MTPAAPDWAAWLYRLQMVAITAVMLWDSQQHQQFLAETDWPKDVLPKVIEAAVHSDYARMAIIGFVVMGLVTRNLVRNWNWKAGKSGIEASFNGNGGTEP